MELLRIAKILPATARVVRRVVPCLLPLLLLAVAATAEPLPKLPLGERWYTVTMQGDLVGFVRTEILPNKDGYEIIAESGAKMVVLGFTREATARERYLVGTDLALKSFSVEQVIDRSPLNFTGRVGPKGIAALVTTGGVSKEKFISHKGPVYPPALVNLLPLRKGTAAGRKYKVQMLDPEGVKVKLVAITAVGPETVAGTSAYHFRNDLYPFVDNDVWVDAAGNTLRESVRGGLIVTEAGSAAVVRQALLGAAIAKRDLVLDFSLIRLAKPLERPANLTRLVVELEGYPPGVPLQSGPGQLAERLQGERVRIAREQQPGQAGLELIPQLLASTPRIQADAAEIVRQVPLIMGNERDPRRMVEKLVPWVAEYVKDTVQDGQSALDTLNTRNGNCVGHARLFVALARAAGLPSRLAVGLVYLPGKGFLYHAWAEVYAGSWLAVDPALNQVPADLTHLKLAEGDTPDDVAAVAGLIGNLRAEVVEQRYDEQR